VTAGRRPTVAAIGSVSWDVLITVDDYPVPPGRSDFIHAWTGAPGGTTGNTAVAAARLGAAVTLAAVTGNDANGQELRLALTAEGIDIGGLGVRDHDPTDACLIIVSKRPPTRTIYWRRGARLGVGDVLDLSTIVAHDVLLLDVDDEALHRRIAAELAAWPERRARVLGSLQFPAGTASTGPWPDAWPLVLGLDVATGDEAEWLRSTGATSSAALVEMLQRAMRGAQLQAAFITRGERGCMVCTVDEYVELPAFSVAAVDTTGAGDAFAGGVAYGMAGGWDWVRIGRFANAVGALSTRALGAQSALPTLEVTARLSDGTGEETRVG
jgi:sugar/nucleoside kinase (ribokinase family)